MFSKWLGDAAGVDSQDRFEPFLDIHNTLLERSRNPADLTHQFKANYSYDLPIRANHGWNRLLSGWITVNLPGYQSLTDWQTAHFGDAQAPGAAPEADPDGDGANNLLEYLTGTDPMSDAEAWKISVRLAGATVEISYRQIANRGFQVEWSADLTQPGSWRPLDVPGNRPFFPATNSTSIVTDVITSTPFRLYRVRVFEP